MTQNTALIDIGNTSIKCYTADSLELICRVERIQDIELPAPIHHCVISNVRYASVDIRLALYEKHLTCHILHASRDALPIPSEYKSLSTLGVDRIASAIGAERIYPKTHCLIVDLGTCLKLDFLHATRGFLGGKISPGLHMRFQALHEFTGKLPHIEEKHQIDSDFLSVGQSTQESIKRAVYGGILAEIQQQEQILRKEFGSVNTIFSGGDINMFSKHMNFTIFADDKLIPLGIKTWYASISQ